LAVLPDILWDAASRNGIIIGQLNNHIYDEWSITTWSMMLNDGDGLLINKNECPILTPIAPENISQRISNLDQKQASILSNYIHSLRPVGLFADKRTS